VAVVRVSVGSVDVQLDGVDVSVLQVRGLLRLMAEVSLAVGEEAAEPEEPRQPMGFTAHIERLPEEILSEDLSWYFDDE
jgi:hypothetical protein